MSAGRGPVMFNLRVRRDDGGRMTKKELHDVLVHIRETGEVPEGHAVAGIEWKNPEKASLGWRRGSAEDLQKFVPIIRRMSLGSLLGSFTAAELAGREPESARDVKRRNELQARAAKWHRARAKEVRQADRLRTREARGRHRRRAEQFRKRFARAIEALEELEFPEGREYELAVDYARGKGGRR